MQGFDRFPEFLLGPVLGAHGSFLVELAQVVEVVGGVPLVLLLVGFVGGRYPHGRHADLVQVGGVLLELCPQFSFVGQIPFEILHHYTVFHDSKNLKG